MWSCNATASVTRSVWCRWSDAFNFVVDSVDGVVNCCFRPVSKLFTHRYFLTLPYDVAQLRRRYTEHIGLSLYDYYAGFDLPEGTWRVNCMCERSCIWIIPRIPCKALHSMVCAVVTCLSVSLLYFIKMASIRFCPGTPHILRRTWNKYIWWSALLGTLNRMLVADWQFHSKMRWDHWATWR